MNKPKITDYRNLDTDETGPAHVVGTDAEGDDLYLVPEGWMPVGPHWFDADGYAHATKTTEGDCD